MKSFSLFWPSLSCTLLYIVMINVYLCTGPIIEYLFCIVILNSLELTSVLKLINYEFLFVLWHLWHKNQLYGFWYLWKNKGLLTRTKKKQKQKQIIRKRYRTNTVWIWKRCWDLFAFLNWIWGLENGDMCGCILLLCTRTVIRPISARVPVNLQRLNKAKGGFVI